MDPHRKPQKPSEPRSVDALTLRQRDASAELYPGSAWRTTSRSSEMHDCSLTEIVDGEDGNSEESGFMFEDGLVVEDGTSVSDETPSESEDEEKISLSGDDSHPDMSLDKDEDWQDRAQLSPVESVPNDMGSLALERSPSECIHHDNSSGVGRSTFLNGDFSQLTDAEIMLRAGTGDDACFEFLAAKYRRPIISFMYRMVHNQAIAEELAQEVFLRVYRARGSYRAEARFTTWLYRIASNMAINHARDTKFERASSSVYLDQADEDTGTTPDVADLRPLAEHGMLRDERMRHIRDQVMALPDRQRMAVVMHKYQDMDYKQIGSVLKLSESATKSLLFRAYQTLRERLKEFA